MERKEYDKEDLVKGCQITIVHDGYYKRQECLKSCIRIMDNEGELLAEFDKRVWDILSAECKVEIIDKIRKGWG